MRVWLVGCALLGWAAAQSVSREELLARRDAILRRAVRPRGATRFSRPVVLATGDAAADGPRRIKLSPSRPSPSISTSRRRRISAAQIRPNNYPPTAIRETPPSPFGAPPRLPSQPDLTPSAPAPAASRTVASQAQPVIKPSFQQIPSFPSASIQQIPQQPQVPQTPQLTAEQLAQIKNLPNVGPILKRTAGLLGFPPGTAIGDAIPTNTKPLTDFLAGLPPQPAAGAVAPEFFQGQGPVNAFPGAGGALGGAQQSLPAGFPLPAQSQAVSPLLNIFKSISRNAGFDRFFQANQGGIQIPGLDALVSSRSPPVPGIPRIPGLPLLPGGIPRDSTGQVDVLRLATLIGRRFTQGRSVSDYFPPDRIQSFADNVTESLLPDTADVELEKMMGRWFEGINTPDASNEKCIVHHYGGLSSTGQGDKNVKTFSALKIFREGSEFGQVRYSIGFAFRGGHRKGMLQFHYSGAEGSEPQPFWVYKVGPEVEDALGQRQYEYAVVSNWIKYPFTVLVRDPDAFKEKYEVEVLRWLEDNNFVNSFTTAFNLVQPTTYSECQYSKSTYKVLG